ncbi:MAG: single-stranded-DNA-specific exonuclease RecJ [Lachnospiraceae bacterium]|nr:single-stranded-DNA-specific exonuclease RecJ [Lachnospiraceae bacterium]
MEKWFVTNKHADFEGIAARFGIDPVTARVIRNRDVIGYEAIHEFLKGGTECFHDPMRMKGMDKAAGIVKEKIAEGKKIRIMGDYDIDGIMSSYILKRGFAELGADADIRIPDRITDGYGMSERMIREAHEDGVDTIVTCDNGISAGKEIALAKSLGMTVVVTDHHEVLHFPEEADAVVDPKQEGETYPYTELCGAGVAWKLILALGGDPEMKLLQFVAFATIGDVVALTGENRVMVKEGLRRLHHTDNPGMLALSGISGVDINSVGSYQVGFVLGPCFNASGRLDTAMLGLDLLFAENEEQAGIIARKLSDLNDSRKRMTEEGVAEAFAMVEQEKAGGEKVYVIFLPDIHESVAGIIAGRIREKYHHPTIVLTRTEKGLKGSGRSTENYNMFEELSKVEPLMTKFGGHPMAAGLSLEEEKLEEFRKELNEKCALGKDDFYEKVKVDMVLPLSKVTSKLTDELRHLEPFGTANPRPLFAAKDVHIRNPRVLGAKRNVFRGIAYFPDGRRLDVISFTNVEELARKAAAGSIMITYYPDFNEFMGRKNLQAVITHFH